MSVSWRIICMMMTYLGCLIHFLLNLSLAWCGTYIGNVHLNSPCKRDRLLTPVFLGFPCGWAVKESACNVGDLGSIPGLGRSPGEGKGYPLQYSGLENSMNYIVHGVTKNQTKNWQFLNMDTSVCEKLKNLFLDIVIWYFNDSLNKLVS